MIETYALAVPIHFLHMVSLEIMGPIHDVRIRDVLIIWGPCIHNSAHSHILSKKSLTHNNAAVNTTLLKKAWTKNLFKNLYEWLLVLQQSPDTACLQSYNSSVCNGKPDDEAATNGIIIISNSWRSEGSRFYEGMWRIHACVHGHTQNSCTMQADQVCHFLQKPKWC